MSTDLEEYVHKLEALVVSGNEASMQACKVIADLMPRLCELEEKVAKIIKESEK